MIKLQPETLSMNRLISEYCSNSYACLVYASISLVSTAQTGSRVKKCLDSLFFLLSFFSIVCVCDKERVKKKKMKVIGII